MEISQKKIVLREALTQKATELKATQGGRAGALVWLAKEADTSLKSVQNWVNPAAGWMRTQKLEATVWRLLNYTICEDGSIVPIVEAKKEEPTPTTPSTKEETEIALHAVIAMLSKLRRDQWEKLIAAAKLIDQEGGIL